MSALLDDTGGTQLRYETSHIGGQASSLRVELGRQPVNKLGHRHALVEQRQDTHADLVEHEDCALRLAKYDTFIGYLLVTNAVAKTDVRGGGGHDFFSMLRFKQSKKPRIGGEIERSRTRARDQALKVA